MSIDKSSINRKSSYHSITIAGPWMIVGCLGWFGKEIGSVGQHDPADELQINQVVRMLGVLGVKCDGEVGLNGTKEVKQRDEGQRYHWLGLADDCVTAWWFRRTKMPSRLFNVSSVAGLFSEATPFLIDQDLNDKVIP